MKIVFFGTPAFSVPFLQALNDDLETEVVAVVCQPDKPKGRGNKLCAPETKIFAVNHGIPVYQPKTLKTDEVLLQLKALGGEMFVIVAYGKIVPQDVLDIPRHGALNVHPSLLPLYRGPSPMQWAILNGDAQTGVTIMQLDAGMDTGPILKQKNIDLDDTDTYLSLTEKVQSVGPTLLIETIKGVTSGTIQARPQDHVKATLTRLLTKEDGHIHWNSDCLFIDRLVRAYNPWPGTWSNWNKEQSPTRIKIFLTRPTNERKDCKPGTVFILNDRLFITCKNGSVEILELQIEGKSKMKTGVFILGNREIEGAILT